MNRTSWYATPGNIALLSQVTEPIDPPGDHEVQVEIRAIGLNFADIFSILGLYEAAPKKKFIPGLEYAGTVMRTGKNVSGFKTGDRIMGITRFGAYTSHLNMDSRYVIKIPEDWNFNEGASYLVPTLTAYYGLVVLGNLQKGQTVLIHSGTGGVGLQALKICRKMDAYTIGSIGNPAKMELALKEGYDQVILRNEKFRAEMEEALEDRGLHLIMDSIGGPYFSIPFDMLEPMGRAVVFGSARYATRSDKPRYLKLLYHWLTRPRVDPQQLTGTNRSVMGFNLIWLFDKVEIMHNCLAELESMKLPKPYVGHTFQFQDLKEAIRLFQSGKTTGKVVVEIPG